MGAISRTDQKHYAIISGVKFVDPEDGGVGYVIELFFGDGEVIEHMFSWLWTGDEVTLNTKTAYSHFCDVLGISSEVKLRDQNLIGKEIGIAVDDVYGIRRITGFYPVGELATMATID